MDDQKAAALIREHGLSVTKMRKKILQTLAGSKHLYSVNDLALVIGEASRKSIYNNVKQLINAGMAESHAFGGVARYALADNNPSANGGSLTAHIVSTHGKIGHIALPKSIFDEISKVAVKHGHTPVTIRIDIKVK